MQLRSTLAAKPQGTKTREPTVKMTHWNLMTASTYVSTDWTLTIEQTPEGGWILTDHGRTVKSFDTAREAKDWNELWQAGKVRP